MLCSGTLYTIMRGSLLHHCGNSAYIIRKCTELENNNNNKNKKKNTGSLVEPVQNTIRAIGSAVGSNWFSGVLDWSSGPPMAFFGWVVVSACAQMNRGDIEQSGRLFSPFS